MLSEEERDGIRQVVERSGHWRAGSIEALMLIQERRGYVPDEALVEAAELLDMSPTQLEGVATFFSLIFRRPVGKHVILLCTSITCYIMGKDRLLEHLQERLGIGMGETTQDGLFTLLPVECLGCCDRAPAMMVDGELYGDLTCERIDQILESCRKGTRDG